MRFISKLRTWINRDDGKYYRAGNKNLAWHEVAGYLLLILSLGLFWIPTLEGEAVKRLAIVFLALALILLIGGAVAKVRSETEHEL